MPNWVFNYVSVSGEQAELDRLQTQLNQPYVTNFPKMNFNDGDVTLEPETQVFSNPVFSFYNVIKPPLDDPQFAEEYYAREPKQKTELSHTDPMWWADVMANAYVSNHWYDWHNTHWGTKWDIGVRDDEQYPDTELEIENHQISYRFNTAWSPVPNVITELSKQFPTLEFYYEYEEEQGWGGKETYLGGELISEEHYDIPQSHADELASNREYCSRCEGRTDLAYVNTDPEALKEMLEYELYDDCPLTKIVQETLDSLPAVVVEQY